MEGGVLEFFFKRLMLNVLIFSCGWPFDFHSIDSIVLRRQNINCRQDFHYFPYSKHSMLAVFIHLDDTAPGEIFEVGNTIHLSTDTNCIQY